MKIRQIIVFSAPEGYEHLDELEVDAIAAARNKNLPDLLKSINDENVKDEQLFVFPDDIDGDTASNALYGSLIRRLRVMAMNPFEHNYLDFALVEIDGVWRNAFEYDGNANLIHFKQKV